MQANKIQSAYTACLTRARAHYENFPVASVLIEKNHRNATAAIYSYARQADDIADEGNKTSAERHKALDIFSDLLMEINNNRPVDDPTFIALQDSIQRYDLPLAPFEDLLIAFRMDIDKQRFADFDELTRYCRYSANPVGELILRLHHCCNETTKPLSDSICTALQLINFLQDISEDFQERNRIYIPQDEMAKFSITEEMLKEKTNSTNLTKLIDQQIIRAISLLVAGTPIIQQLRGRLKWLIKLTVCSALQVGLKLSKRDNVFDRPTLSRLDWVKILLASIYFRPDKTHAKILSNIKHRFPNG